VVFFALSNACENTSIVWQKSRLCWSWYRFEMERQARQFISLTFVCV